MNFEYTELLDELIKMLFALLCGGILGIERGRKKRPAGMRTYMLVCLGATLVMMTNQYISEKYNIGDVARMGAQVISGIGFLGAGTIITTGHNRVKGLTTAAGLWVSACIGLAIGIGYYEGAVLGMIMIYLVMVVLHKLDNRLLANTRTIILYVEFKKMAAIRRLTAYIRENQIEIEDIEVESPDNSKSARSNAVVTLRLPAKSVHAELIEQIDNLEGIIFVEEL